MMDYIRDGSAIYRQSFATIRAEARLERLPADLETVAVRLIHACGMTDIVGDLAYSSNAATAGRIALAQGAPILCDAQMVANGVTRTRLSAHNAVICTLNEPEVPAIAKKLQNTRSAAALESYGERISKAQWWPLAMPRPPCFDCWKCWRRAHPSLR
jgi:precorrin-8X/cobalt-precorrin-8 methylmutase